MTCRLVAEGRCTSFEDAGCRFHNSFFACVEIAYGSQADALGSIFLCMPHGQLGFQPCSCNMLMDLMAMPRDPMGAYSVNRAGESHRCLQSDNFSLVDSEN